MCVRILLPGLYLTLLYSKVLAQQVPRISCPQFFEYLRYNQNFIGRFTIPLDTRSENNALFVEFSQRTPISSNYVGRLSLFEDEETTKYNLRNGLPIQYRVDFPVDGVVPKLTKITLNNFVICSAAPYPPPNTLISLTHSLHSTAVPLLGIGNPTFPEPIRPTFNQPQWSDFDEPIQTGRRRLPSPVPPYLSNETQSSPSLPTQPSQPWPPRQTTTRPPRTVQTTTPSPTASTIQQLNAICGRPAVSIIPLIFKGRAVTDSSMPWIAAIFEKKDNGLSFFCGGTLVSHSTVVSAAHCFRVNRDLPASRTVVALGRNRLDDYSSGILREVEIVLVHNEYKLQSLPDADIALIKLSQPVSFDGDSIKPICLWNNNFRFNLPTGEKSYVAGWGADDKGNSHTTSAQMVDTDIVVESDCLRQHSSRWVTPRTICAQNKDGAGPCSGDSGGGLILRENNVWVLRGIVSAAQSVASTCDLSKAVIFCDLAKHIEWVQASMWL